ncbi:MAG: hypothetical protein H5T65_00235 [Chloroflexi bacterium]|nr:hypothetical protein [Chloroflexota bacterium]
MATSPARKSNRVTLSLLLLLAAFGAWLAVIAVLPHAQAWTHWVPISPYGCINPDIAADPFGDVYAVWEREANGDIFLARRHGDAWLSPVNLSNSADASRTPRVAADLRGWLHVVWAEGNEGQSDIYYTSWNRSAWSTPRNLSQSAATESLAPAIAVDDANRVHVTWVEKAGTNREVLYTSGQGDGWAAPLNLSNTPGRSEDPDITLDANGNVHVAWQEGMPAAPEILHRYLTPDGWAPVANVSRNPSFSRHPAVVGDRQGRVIAVWEDNATGTSELHAAMWDVGEWSPARNVVIMPSGASSQIDLVVDDANVLHVLWDDLVVDQWEIYYIRWNGAAWSGVRELSHNWGYSFWPALALDSRGILHAVWTDSEPFFPSEGIVYCWQAADSPLPLYPSATPAPTATPTATATAAPTAPSTPTPTPTPTPFLRYLPIVMRP